MTTAQDIAAVVGTTPEWWWPRGLTCHCTIYDIKVWYCFDIVIEVDHAAALFRDAARQGIYAGRASRHLEVWSNKYGTWHVESSDDTGEIDRLGEGPTELAALTAAVRTLEPRT